MMGFPLTLPVETSTPRLIAVERIGLRTDVTTLVPPRVLLIELLTEAEVTAVTDWVAARRPAMAYGGAL